MPVRQVHAHVRQREAQPSRDYQPPGRQRVLSTATGPRRSTKVANGAKGPAYLSTGNRCPIRTTFQDEVRRSCFKPAYWNLVALHHGGILHRGRQAGSRFRGETDLVQVAGPRHAADQVYQRRSRRGHAGTSHPSQDGSTGAIRQCLAIRDARNAPAPRRPTSRSDRRNDVCLTSRASPATAPQVPSEVEDPGDAPLSGACAC